MSQSMPNKFYENYGKRLFDFSVALVGLILLIPLLIVVSILVRVFFGKPVLFKQQRPGYKEKIFTIIKFRSMTERKDKHGILLSDEYRLTKFGKFLRASSLDELPELFNIIKGEMSIVGPRPLLVHYLPLYNEHQQKRHYVRPGLTGLAQVSGRNAIAWEDKFNIDVKYTETVSFVNDLKIIYSTVYLVVKRHGISSIKSATMEEFEGNVIEEAIKEVI